MPKHIIFDCSDTLLRLGSLDYLAELIGSSETANELHYRIFRSDAWYKSDCGTITQEELEKEILSMLSPEEQEIGKKYLKNWNKHYTLINGIPELLAELKDKGYRLYILSDFPACFEELWNSFEIFKLFDGRVVSYENACRKSDGTLFECILKKYNLDPKDCFFTDDAPINVKMAEHYGIKGHVFTDTPTLRKALGL